MYPELVTKYKTLRKRFLVTLLILRYVLSALNTVLSFRKRRVYQWFFRVKDLRAKLQTLSKQKQPVAYWLTRWQFIHARYSLASGYEVMLKKRMWGSRTSWYVKCLLQLLRFVMWPVSLAIVLLTLVLFSPAVAIMWLRQRRAARQLAKARREHLMSLTRAALVLFLFGVAKELAKVDRSQVSPIVVLVLVGLLACCQPKAKQSVPVGPPVSTVDSTRIPLQNRADSSRSRADQAASASNSAVTNYETDAKTYDALRNPLP